MQLPFEILHIHKGETIEAYEVINEMYYLRIVTLAPLRDGFVVTSNLDLRTAKIAETYPNFQTAYVQYYLRLTEYLTLERRVTPDAEMPR